MIVAVHQPNFFPWLGYFDKLARCDVFVILDDVQFPKTGGTWMNRVKILRRSGASWLTAPIDRSYSGVRKVAEMRFAPAADWRSALWQMLESSYLDAPFWAQVRSAVSELVQDPSDSLADYNLSAIRTLAQGLGLSADRLRLASEFGVEVGGTERLIALTKAVGGSAYLCGAGSEGYLQPVQFHDSGIQLLYQKFQSPRYRQVGGGEFVPGLSVIDLVANLGWKGAAAALSGRQANG